MIAELAKLTDEELDVRLAELRGLDVIHDPAGRRRGYFTPSAAKLRKRRWPSAAVVKVVPRYAADLNECAKVEAGLTDEQTDEYLTLLRKLCVRRWSLASARQRTIALVATLEAR